MLVQQKSRFPVIYGTNHENGSCNSEENMGDVIW